MRDTTIKWKDALEVYKGAGFTEIDLVESSVQLAVEVVNGPNNFPALV